VGITLSAVAPPQVHFDLPLAVWEAVLKQEESVTAGIHRLYRLAGEEQDYATEVMLQWFVTEQVEERRRCQAPPISKSLLLLQRTLRILPPRSPCRLLSADSDLQSVECLSPSNQRHTLSRKTKEYLPCPFHPSNSAENGSCRWPYSWRYGPFVARTAFARVTANTVDPIDIVADNGHHLTIAGPIAVTAGEKVELRVTVSQRSTGAVAQGVAFLSGTGAPARWKVEAIAEGAATFEEGPATAVALARTTAGGKTTDAHQWLVEVQLVPE
jgi:hypothetical protein